MLGGSPGQVPERFEAASPVELLPNGCRQLLIHGADDDIVPISFGRDYVEAAQAAGDDATLLALSDADHFAVIDPESSVWPEIQRAVLKLLAS